MTESQMDSRARVAQWAQSIRTLAKQTGTEAEVRPYLWVGSDGSEQTTQVALIGAPNVGKSNLLNSLIAKKVLPVTALPSAQAFTIEGTTGTEGERFVMEGMTGRLPDLAARASSEAKPDQPIQVYLDAPWMAERNLTIAEQQAIDVSDSDLLDAIHDAIRGKDAVILAIDCLMPVRRSETVVLSECARRELPTIVALTKTDRLPAEELSSLAGYVTKQIQSYAPQAPVVEIAIGAVAVTGVEQLKEAIDDVLAGTDFASVRLRQTVEEFLSALQLISGAAAAAMEVRQTTEEQRATEARGRQFASEEQAARWSDLTNQMQSRRQDLDEQIRVGLDAKKRSMCDLLQHDLEGRTDIKVWWEKELPYRLSRELRAAAESLSGAANRKIAMDLHWLQDELARRFRLPAAALPLGASVKLDGNDVPVKDIALWNTGKMRIVTRVGQAAAMVMAGRLLFTAGLSGATMGLSILAGLAAEQAIVLAASKDREKVRSQIDTVVEKASKEYAVDVSRKLRAGYEEILEALRQQEQRWQRSQSAALKMAQTSGSAAETDWARVVEDADALDRELRGAVADTTPE